MIAGRVFVGAAASHCITPQSIVADVCTLWLPSFWFHAAASCERAGGAAWNSQRAAGAGGGCLDGVEGGSDDLRAVDSEVGEIIVVAVEVLEGHLAGGATAAAALAL